MSEPARQFFEDEPIIIRIGHDADGVVFALDPLSRNHLRSKLPKDARIWPRVFISEETRGQLTELDPPLLRQIATLLTSLSPETLTRDYNGVCFIDPERDLEFSLESPDRPEAAGTSPPTND